MYFTSIVFKYVKHQRFNRAQEGHSPNVQYKDCQYDLF